MPSDVDEEIRQAQQARGTSLTAIADDDVYNTDRYAGMDTSIAPGEAQEDGAEPAAKRSSFTAPKHLLEAVPQQPEDDDPMSQRSNRIADREDEYHARRQRVLSPSRADPFAKGAGGSSERSYRDVMAEADIARQKDEIRRKLAEQSEEGATGVKKRRRWDAPAAGDAGASAAAGKKQATRWDDVATPAPVGSKWDSTPTPGRDAGGGGGGSKWDATPTPGRVADASKWDSTPTPGRAAASSKWDATPTPGRGAAAGAGITS